MIKGSHCLMCGYQGDLLRHISRSGPLTGAWIVSCVLRPTLLALDHLHQQVSIACQMDAQMTYV